MFCVFDGHGGREVATFASQVLPGLLLDGEPEGHHEGEASTGGSNKGVGALRLMAEGAPADAVEAAVASAFHHVHEMGRGERLRGGATACVLLCTEEVAEEVAEDMTEEEKDDNGKGDGDGTDGDGTDGADESDAVRGRKRQRRGRRRRVVCANAGDSRCVAGLLGSGGAVRLSVDHTPSDPSEKCRIQTAGGSVEFGRLDGSLAVSRSLGDYSFERDGLIPTPYCIECADALPVATAHSSLSSLSSRSSLPPPVPLTPLPSSPLPVEFVVIASDGLWDVVTDQEGIDIARKAMDTDGGTTAHAAAVLAELAVSRECRDDTSVVVVSFKE